MFSNWTVNQIFLSLSILKVVLLLTALFTLMFRIGRKFSYVFVTEHSYSWGITTFALKSVAKSTCTSTLAIEEGNTFESQNGVAVVQTSKGKLGGHCGCDIRQVSVLLRTRVFWAYHTQPFSKQYLLAAGSYNLWPQGLLL